MCDLERRLQCARTTILKVVDLAHSEGAKLGFYTLLPLRNYPAAKSQSASTLAQWKAYGNKLKPIALFPSLYTFDDDQSA